MPWRLEDPVAWLMVRLVLPLWIVAGVADWMCHQPTGIERTTGAKESLIHLLTLAEMGVLLLSALFLEINALAFLIMIGAFLTHEATSFWDVSYAVKARNVTPLEQHVHSFLEIISLIIILLVATRHWPQFMALFGAGHEPARFDLTLRANPPPRGYIIAILGAPLFLDLLPYLEELWRTLAAKGASPRPNRVLGSRPRNFD